MGSSIGDGSTRYHCYCEVGQESRTTAPQLNSTPVIGSDPFNIQFPAFPALNMSSYGQVTHIPDPDWNGYGSGCDQNIDDCIEGCEGHHDFSRPMTSCDQWKCLAYCA